MTRFDIALRICASLVCVKLNLWVLKPMGLWHIGNIVLLTLASYWFGTLLADMMKRR